MDKEFVGMLHCARCGEPIGVALDRRLRKTFEQGVKYSDGKTLCDACEKEDAKMKAIVDEGGIYFRCLNCKAEGAIMYAADTKELIDKVRKVSGIAKGAVGIEFHHCQNCGEYFE